MNKLHDMHAGHGIREEETVTTNIPAPAFTESKPKGVHVGQHDAHIDSNTKETKRGESRTPGMVKEPNANSQSEPTAGRR